MHCPFYKMDMCSAVEDIRLAKLYTSKQRCMIEFENCQIYMKNSKSVKQPPVTESLPTNELLPPDDSWSTQISVDCEFFELGRCNALRRSLTRFEAIRCSRFFDTCPIRAAALKMESGLKHTRV